MKNLLIGLSFLTLASNAFALNGEEVFGKHSTSIIYLTVDSVNEKGEMERSTGTGFFIHESGLIFTNRHVIEGHKNVDGITIKGNSYKNIEVKGVHTYADVALLKVDKIKEGDTSLKISDSDSKIGEDVFLIGNPEGLRFRITSGLLSFSGNPQEDELKFESQGKRLQYTASTLHGSSGSPVINREGNVIGIHYRGYKEKKVVGLDSQKRNYKLEVVGEQGYNYGWDKIYLKEMLSDALSNNSIAKVEFSERVNPEISNSVLPKNDLASLIRELKAYTPPEERKLGSL